MISMRSRRRVVTAVALALFVSVAAAATDAARTIPLDAAAWTTHDEAIGTGTLVFEEHLGRRALRLNGAATMKGVAFKDGMIEFDVAFENTRGFAGVIFRRPDSRDGESFYLRSHQSGNPDANQYTPIFNGLSSWQIYHGPQYATPVEYRYDEWMRVRVIVRGDEAEFHLDGKPFLHVDDLLREPIEGGVSLWTNVAPAWFSAISVSSEPAEFELEPAPAPTMARGAITDWEVSEELSWDEVSGVDRLDPDWMAKLEWTPLAVERNGIANLARVADRAEGSTVLARVTLPPEHARELRFGFSDEARAYVDGRLVFEGDDTYRSRDYRFLGTVGLYDTLFTEPDGKPVTFVFAVREAFGGWALAGAAPWSVPTRTAVEATEGPLGKRIHELLVEHEREGFSGAVVAAVGGKPILEAGYGLADRRRGAAFTPDTVAQIGSITKPLTALAVLDLVLEGEIELDAPVGRYLPDAATPARDVTIHQLLTHTSGMPEYCGPDFKPYSLGDLLRRCMSERLRFEPGTRWAYSNAGYSVLGAVMEAVSGRELDEQLKAEVLAPSGLGSITYFPPEDAEYARGYSGGKDRGVVSELILELEGDFWAFKGNGGMQASARDMFGLYEALAGRRAFDERLVELALEPREPDGNGNWNSYGWGVGRDPDGAITRISHAGSDGTFFSYFWWNPRTDRFFYLVGNAGEERTIRAALPVRKILSE